MHNSRHDGHLRAIHLQNLGLRLLTVSYCCLGALLGQVLRAALSGKAYERPRDGFDLLALALLGNFLGFSALVLLFRRRAAEPPCESFLQPLAVIVRGLPAGSRVAFALFILAWLAGVALGVFCQLAK